MRRLILLGFGFLLLGCGKNINPSDISLLNGYWEIEKVTFADGSSKDYTVNTSVDYIEVTGLQGFKKKVQPTLNGTFNTTNDAEFFTILEKEGSFLIYYKNSLSEWQEQLVTLSEKRFSVISQDNITYTFKRYQPINVTP